jgi:hypothetical protein
VSNWLESHEPEASALGGESRAGDDGVNDDEGFIAGVSPKEGSSPSSIVTVSSSTDGPGGTAIGVKNFAEDVGEEGTFVSLLNSVTSADEDENESVADLVALGFTSFNGRMPKEKRQSEKKG